MFRRRYCGDRCLAIPGSRVSTVEKPYLWVTTLPESATRLRPRETHEGQTGHLASLAAHRCRLFDVIIKRGQLHCST